MPEVTTSAYLIDNLNLTLLHEELKRALGDRFDGVSTRQGFDKEGQPNDLVRVHLLDGAAADDEQTALSVIAAHDPAGQSERQRTLTALKEAADNAAGKAASELSAGDVKALLAVLLLRAKALTPDGKVRPASEWV